jgi:predicted nucleic acid-binding protein
MRVVVDTNIAFSAILNTNSKIGKVLLHRLFEICNLEPLSKDL